MDTRTPSRPTPGLDTQTRARMLGLLFAAVLAGCGGGGGDATPAPAPTPSAAPAPSPSTALPALQSPSALTDGVQLGETRWPDGDTSNGGQGQKVGTFACPTVGVQMHNHAHLSIFEDGRMLAIPNDIGSATPAAGFCRYGLHAHDRSGKIHIEPERDSLQALTLGSYFAIWGMPLARDNIAGITGKPVRIFVKDDGGALFEHTGAPGDVELKSRREITIQIGTDLASVPTYDWGTVQ